MNKRLPDLKTVGKVVLLSLSALFMIQALFSFVTGVLRISEDAFGRGYNGLVYILVLTAAGLTVCFGFMVLSCRIYLRSSVSKILTPCVVYTLCAVRFR